MLIAEAVLSAFVDPVCKIPTATVVGPVKLLLPDSVSTVPESAVDTVNEPAPEMFPE